MFPSQRAAECTYLCEAQKTLKTMCLLTWVSKGVYQGTCEALNFILSGGCAFSARKDHTSRSRGPTRTGRRKKLFAWGAFPEAHTKSQHINSISLLSIFGGRRGAKTTPRSISTSSSRPPVSNGVQVVPLHVYLRKQYLDRTFISVLYETVFGAFLSTSLRRTNAHRRC